MKSRDAGHVVSWFPMLPVRSMRARCMLDRRGGKRYLTGSGDVRAAPCQRSGGFDKGRWPVRLFADRAGFWPARKCPMGAAARVPLSNPLRSR